MTLVLVYRPQSNHALSFLLTSMALWEVLVATQMQVRFKLAPAAAERKTAASSTYGEFVEMILVKVMFGNDHVEVMFGNEVKPFPMRRTCMIRSSALLADVQSRNGAQVLLSTSIAPCILQGQTRNYNV